MSFECQVGQLEVQKDAGAGDAETREQLIKNHFTQRINEMTLQIQQADSKAVSFHAEVRNICHLVDFCYLFSFKSIAQI